MRQDNKAMQKQRRPMRMSHLMITYVLHHRALHTNHNRYVMMRMAQAARHMFQTPRVLETMIRFGQKLSRAGVRSLITSRKNAHMQYDNYKPHPQAAQCSSLKRWPSVLSCMPRRRGVSGRRLAGPPSSRTNVLACDKS